MGCYATARNKNPISLVNKQFVAYLTLFIKNILKVTFICNILSKSSNKIFKISAQQLLNDDCYCTLNSMYCVWPIPVYSFFQVPPIERNTGPLVPAMRYPIHENVQCRPLTCHKFHPSIVTKVLTWHDIIISLSVQTLPSKPSNGKNTF